MQRAFGLLRQAFLGVMLVVATGLAAMPAGAATLRIIALPQTVDVHATESAIAGLALSQQPGDTLIVFDGRNRTKLTTIANPDDPSYARMTRKIEIAAPGMAAIRNYFANPPPSGVDGSVIDASAFLDEVAPIIAEHTSDTVRIALIGSPWFTTPGALGHKEYEGAFPSDGMIQGDRSRSPIGTRGRHDLNGATVDYCVTAKPAAFATPEHRDRVERAWSLIIAERGGQLTTFTTDLKSCFDRFAAAKAPEAKVYAIDPTDAEIYAMYRPNDPAPRILPAPPIKSAVPAPPPTNNRAAEAARFNQPARTTRPSTLTGTAWIGIQWREPVDLDLYVRCSPRAAFLFFANQHTAEGTHEYDFRGGTGSTFETVDLTQPCADISKAEVFVNFYSGRVSTPITGIIALQFDGGIYKSNFTMPALAGNGARGLSAAADMGGPYWVRVDVPALLRLRAGAQRSAAG